MRILSFEGNLLAAARPTMGALGILLLIVAQASDAQTRESGPVFVRPAWARSWRWKSSRELTTASEVNRNCVRVTERGEEVSSETVSRWTKIGYKAMSIRASWQEAAKLLWSKVDGVNPAVVR